MYFKNSKGFPSDFLWEVLRLLIRSKAHGMKMAKAFQTGISSYVFQVRPLKERQEMLL